MCRSGCPTQDHLTWGECFRAAGVEFGNPGQRRYSKAWDNELALYKRARTDGLNPRSTKTNDSLMAYKMADRGVFRQ